ncbi:hypothetical protein IFR05_008223 [Cadophora sp. M221]|nr:hypothetical protein IFR05_008223 [Cadophora sp. M221]
MKTTLFLITLSLALAPTSSAAPVPEASVDKRVTYYPECPTQYEQQCLNQSVAGISTYCRGWTLHSNSDWCLNQCACVSDYSCPRPYCDKTAEADTTGEAVEAAASSEAV